jgi:hypothetical protein
MTISLSPRTGVSGILQDGVEVVTIGSTGITAGVPAATTAEIQALTITNKFVNPANAGALALGVGQTWIDVTGSRVLGTTYTNTTGKPIYIKATLADSGTALRLATGGTNSTELSGAVGIIPANASYVVTRILGTGAVATWLELR